MEPGQTTQEAAIVETWEEGGVRGVASEEPIARYEYDIGAGRCKVDIFEIEVEVVEDEEELEPVDPAPLADRVRLGAKVGAGFGAVLGLVSFAAMAPLMLTRLSQTTAAGAPAGGQPG